MQIIIPKQAGPFAGTYEFDLARPFDNWEWHMIKEISGATHGTFEAAVEASDSDVFLAYAVIALTRDGRVPRRAFAQAVELLYELPGFGLDDGIRIIHEKPSEGDEASPPEEALAESASASESTEPSAKTSSESSESPVNTPPATGSPSLDSTKPAA